MIGAINRLVGTNERDCALSGIEIVNGAAIPVSVKNYSIVWRRMDNV